MSASATIPVTRHVEAVRGLWLAGGALYGALNDPNADPPDIEQALQQWRDAVQVHVDPLDTSPAGESAAALTSATSGEGQPGEGATPAGEDNVVQLHGQRPGRPARMRTNRPVGGRGATDG